MSGLRLSDLNKETTYLLELSVLFCCLWQRTNSGL